MDTFKKMLFLALVAFSASCVVSPAYAEDLDLEEEEEVKPAEKKEAAESKEIEEAEESEQAEAPAAKPAEKAETPAAKPAEPEKKEEETLPDDDEIAVEEVKGPSVCWWSPIVFYIPNRLLDLTDLLSLEVGLGTNVAVDVKCTSFCQVGAGVGPRWMAGYTYLRQLGVCYEDGYFCHLICGPKDMNRYYPWGTMKLAWQEVDWFPAPWNQAFADGKRDYWAIGLDLGFVYNVRVMVHPVRLFDLIAGIFFLDPEKDDIRVMESEF